MVNIWIDHTYQSQVCYTFWLSYLHIYHPLKTILPLYMQWQLMIVMYYLIVCHLEAYQSWDTPAFRQRRPLVNHVAISMATVQINNSLLFQVCEKYYGTYYITVVMTNSLTVFIYVAFDELWLPHNVSYNN
jgi:hypothetical protein